MSATPLASSILSERHTALLDELSEALEQPALLWASGYLAGRAAVRKGAMLVVPSNDEAVAPPAAAEARTLTVLYGSQTGNAKRVAEDLAARARAAGLAVQLVRADSYKTHQLKNEKLLYVVISTHSEGDTIEPPDDSRDFIEFLNGRRAPKLPDLHYAVLALGDTSYPGFCGIGREVDARLEALGGKRLRPLGEADVDIETVAGPWTETALADARKELQPAAGAAQPRVATVTPLHPIAAQKRWTRQNPFAAELLMNQRIVSAGSDRDVRHIELSLEGSGLDYQPGDALGVWPRQEAALVAEVIGLLRLDAGETVQVGDTSLPLGQWLAERRELTLLTRPFIEAQAKRGGHADLLRLLQPEGAAGLGPLLKRWQLVDFLARWPAEWDAASLVAALRPLAPRMYSIASSPAVVGEEVHLTVADVHYHHDGKERFGAATRYLFDLAPGASVPVFIDPNDRFRLPADPDTDIILIGPGTGVAPFRAFVQQRAETGAGGRQWLFFGNRRRRDDFLYQTEWLQALREGALSRLSVAFSRDQEHKIYVQDRLREAGAELWSWLEGGAHLYLCGDADHMAPDVQKALLEIIAEHGKKSADEAANWLKELAKAGRYARDVY